MAVKGSGRLPGLKVDICIPVLDDVLTVYVSTSTFRVFVSLCLTAPPSPTIKLLPRLGLFAGHIVFLNVYMPCLSEFAS